MPRHEARATFARKRSTPSLLNPSRLISASASGSLNSRGFGLPGCRARRDRSAFDEAEAERRQAVDVGCVLVEAGRESDAVRKFEAHRAHRRHRNARGQQLRDAELGCDVEAREHHLVRGLGVEREQ